MSLKHTFTCERCDKKVEGKYNGEHFLPPSDWIEIYCPHNVCTKNEHLCPRCAKRAVEKEPQIEAKR